MYHEDLDLWKDLLLLGLREDGWPWDWTTLGIVGEKDKTAKAKIIGRSWGVWAAEGLVHTLQKVAPNVEVRSKLSDGQIFKVDESIVEFKGPVTELLKLERPFLNLAAYVSGIATSTYDMVGRVEKACPKRPPRVCLTRKTLPGYRNLAIHGVCLGGGYPHRVGLSGGVLIKENHIAFAGGVSKAVKSVRAKAPHGLRIQVEVRNLSELKKAVEVEAESILLDNFSPKQVHEAMAWIRKLEQKPIIEISGGLNDSNIALYAIEGVDVLSVGCLTHSVKSVNLSFLIL